MAAGKTREQELKAAMLAARMPAADYKLLAVLLSRAQWKTAVIPPQFQPRSLDELARWCACSLATVKRAISHAADHGWLERRYPSIGGGRGRHTSYQLAVGRDCDCRPPRTEPVPEAVRARQYRARRKAAQMAVTKPAQNDVTPARKPAQFDVTNRLTSRDDAAGQTPVPAKSVSDEGGVVKRAAVTVSTAQEWVDSHSYPDSWKIWAPGSEGEKAQ